MKLVKFLLENISNGSNICEFLPDTTPIGVGVIIKHDHPDYSGAYIVSELADHSDDAIIINHEDII